MTDTNRVSLYLLPEATWGTTPASGTWETLRYTGESLSYNVDTATSSEIRADRNLQDIIRTQASTSGDISFELSADTYDSLLEGVMMGAYASNVLKNGTTLKSYSIEKLFNDGTGNKYHTFKGCRVGGMSLEIGAGDVVTGDFSLTGKDLTKHTASASTGTAAAATVTPVFNAVDNISVLKEGGSTYADKVTSLSLTIDNNLRANQAIANLNPTRIGFGQFSCTGSMSVYFASAAVFDKFVAGTDSSIEFTLSDGTQTLSFLMASIEYTAATILAGGVNADVMAEVDFTAKYNATQACTLKITRVT